MTKRSWYITPEDYQIAKQNGINEETLEARVQDLGWDVDSAIATPVREQNKTGWTKWKNEAIKNGIRYKTFISRINRGWDEKTAACTPVIKNYMKALGKKYGGLNRTVFTKEQIVKMEQNGIKYQTAFARVKYFNWDPEEAVTVPVKKQKELGGENNWGKTNNYFFLKSKEG